jgi:hypothetical protein
VLEQQGLAPLGTEVHPVVEEFVPPRAPAPAERSLRPPDPGVPPMPTDLAAVGSLGVVSGSKVE